jgi:hypothetical protein
MRRSRFRAEVCSVADRYSETFHHPDIAVVDAALYGKVAAVR